MKHQSDSQASRVLAGEAIITLLLENVVLRNDQGAEAILQHWLPDAPERIANARAATPSRLLTWGGAS